MSLPTSPRVESLIKGTPALAVLWSADRWVEKD